MCLPVGNHGWELSLKLACSPRREAESQPHSLQGTISQLSTLSRTTRRCWSIFQNAYKARVEPAAFRWAGPLPPSTASSRDLQMQVARLRNSASSDPNQYLRHVSICRAGLQASTRDAHLRKPPLAMASAWAALSSSPRWLYSVLGLICERNATM